MSRIPTYQEHRNSWSIDQRHSSRRVSILSCLGILLFSYGTLQAAPIKGDLLTQNTATKKQESFKPFTGKIIANKVRLRVRPDLESQIIKQIDKQELLLVVGEEGDFYAVEPPKGTKAYVFRSYVLDNRIEATRVNVRLEPNIEAPIIGQLKAGDQVKGVIAPSQPKWLEIAAPKGAKFYVAKEYLTSVGGAEFLATMEKRKSEVEELLNNAFHIAEAECQKPYEEMELTAATDKFQSILKNYSDFSQAVSQANDALALMKETYLNKKIAFLEAKAELTPEAKQALLANLDEQKTPSHTLNHNFWKVRVPQKSSHSIHLWDALEESLYLSWTAFHSGKQVEDFYLEQKINGSNLCGIVESYDDTVRDRPGDFLLCHNDGTYSYLYSTHVDLSSYVGQQVSLLASPRPNNHFAFPAYFVLSIQ